MQTSEPNSSYSGLEDRLSSWKEIATYLKCGVRTVQRWERLEGLPVHRHQHQKTSTVYAFRSELDAWRNDRASLQIAPSGAPNGSDTSEPEEFEREQLQASSAPAGPESMLVKANGAGTQRQAVESATGAPPALRATFAASAYAPSPARAARRKAVIYGVLLALAIVISAAVFIARERLSPRPAPRPARKMLAVLPFANLSGDPAQDYFSDGLTEEMITELGRLDPGQLGVIARTSAMKYKHTQEDIAQIGKELGVTYVLEGSVRRAQNRVRVSAQLIQVSDQTHLWAESYEGDTRNVLGVQKQVADAITKTIQVNLGRGQQSANPASATLDLDAYDNYLKGRYFWNLRTNESFHKAIGYFNAAIARDPNYSQAYAGLADCYTLLALYGEPVQEVMPRAKAAALKSVSLNDTLPEAHTSFAAVEALWDWNWPASEHEFQRAIGLDPNYSPAHHWYANLYLIPQGRVDEAIAEMNLAATLDPVSLIVTTDLGWSYFVAGQYDKAFEQYSKALDMSPEFLPVHFRLSQYYRQKGEYDKVLAQQQEAMRLDGYHGAILNSLAVAPPVTREEYRKFVRRRLDEILSGSGDIGTSSHNVKLRPDYEGFAGYYAELDDAGEAIKSLQGALRERNPGLIYIAVDPVFAGLRSDARFQEIERRIGLPTR